MDRKPVAWDTIAGTLCVDRPASITTLLALGIGLAYAVILLGPAGASGAAPFWELPIGLLGGTLDIRNAIAGYWWFVQDAWRWPLLAVAKPNWPIGANAELFDFIPIVGLFGKLLFTGFGWAVNPYSWWVTACFALNGAALAVLVSTLGQRSLLAAVLAGAFGAMAPVVQHRFGHMSLMAHWLPVAALACYFHKRESRPGARADAGLIGLCLLACFVHLYLYVMTAAIAAAACLQAVFDQRASLWRGAWVLTGIVLAGVVPLWAFGLLGGWGLADISGDFDRYSMNLMSPFWPQTSGLFRWTGIYWLTRGSIGGTTGQYEGFDYLGGGALLLLGVALGDLVLHRPRVLVAALHRHTVLTMALAVLFIWAVSDRVYVGPYLVFSYQPPGWLATTVLSWFRSCGRFFWPIGWLLVAIGLTSGLGVLRPGPRVALAVLALALQWADVAPWRARFAALFDTPPQSAFGSRQDAARIARAIGQAGAVIVVPPVFCSSDGDDFASPFNVAAVELQLLAARANARMGALYLSRMHADCAKAQVVPSPSVVVQLRDSHAQSPGVAVLLDALCFDVPIARVCSSE
jgi:hypothetical protein